MLKRKHISTHEGTGKLQSQGGNCSVAYELDESQDFHESVTLSGLKQIMAGAKAITGSIRASSGGELPPLGDEVVLILENGRKLRLILTSSQGYSAQVVANGGFFD